MKKTREQTVFSLVIWLALFCFCVDNVTSSPVSFLKAITGSKEHHRVKRQVIPSLPDNTVSLQDQQTIVDLHNQLRRQEGSSDMRKMVSIDTLRFSHCKIIRAKEMDQLTRKVF